ncbi:hypothetical protein ACIO13_21865 [Streptomyces sp. NPDC087425]|uniref:hypothetical protein n=1 Tax=Streptomyces sp. NPDC087425 TaxID=3365787 RepID=UPI0037F496D5
MSIELSGGDLARQALVAARETARNYGAVRKEKPSRRTGAVVRRDGRGPLGLGGAAIGMMMTERGTVVLAASSILICSANGGDTSTTCVPLAAQLLHHGAHALDLDPARISQT